MATTKRTRSSKASAARSPRTASATGKSAKPRTGAKTGAAKAGTRAAKRAEAPARSSKRATEADDRKTGARKGRAEAPARRGKVSAKATGRGARASEAHASAKSQPGKRAGGSEDLDQLELEDELEDGIEGGEAEDEVDDEGAGDEHGEDSDQEADEDSHEEADEEAKEGDDALEASDDDDDDSADTDDAEDDGVDGRDAQASDRAPADLALATDDQASERGIGALDGVTPGRRTRARAETQDAGGAASRRASESVADAVGPTAQRSLSFAASAKAQEAPRAGTTPPPSYSLDRPAPRGAESYPPKVGALLAVGQEVLGIRSYRPGQAEALSQILDGKDVLAVMPTGSGKSMLYQLPSLVSPGVTVVVSPLIALIKDQLDKMVAKGVAAVRIDSTLTVRQRREVDEFVRQPGAKLLLTTPERMADPEFRSFLRTAAGNLGVSRFVVDEAHCVSQWGHDFRPAYLSLRKALEDVGRPPVLATTATAPPHVRADILHQLGIEDAAVVTTTFDRPNLHYEVIVFRDEDEKMKTLVVLLRKLPRPGIVYAATVKKVEELHESLSRWGIPVAKYHGRMSKNERDSEQQRFMDSKDIVMVATNAFGLGVDKPDIRNVLHYHVPGSLEAYAQEAGRGGRDGKPARCVLLFSPDDVAIQEYFLSGTYPTRRQVKAVYETLEAFAASRGTDDSPPVVANIAVSSGVGAQRTRTVLSLLKEERFVIEKDGGLFEIAQPPPDPAQLNERARQYEARRIADRRRLDALLAYVKAPGCRNQVILEYLGESEPPLCGRCDNCLRSREVALAAATEATRLGAAVIRQLDDDSVEAAKPKRDIKARVVRIDQPAATTPAATTPAAATPAAATPAPPAPTVLRRSPGGAGKPEVRGDARSDARLGQRPEPRPEAAAAPTPARSPAVLVRSRPAPPPVAYPQAGEAISRGPGGQPGRVMDQPLERTGAYLAGTEGSTARTLSAAARGTVAADAPQPGAPPVRRLGGDSSETSASVDGNAKPAQSSEAPAQGDELDDDEYDDEDDGDELDDDEYDDEDDGDELDDDEGDDDEEVGEDGEDDGDDDDEGDDDEDDFDDDDDDDFDDDEGDDDEDEDDGDYEIIEKTAAELAEEGIEGPGEITILARKRVPKAPKVRPQANTDEARSAAAAEARRRRRRRRRKRRAMLPPKSAFTTPVLSNPAPLAPSPMTRGRGGGPVVEYVRSPMRIAMAPVASANPNDAGTDRRRNKRRGGAWARERRPGWVPREGAPRPAQAGGPGFGGPAGPGAAPPAEGEGPSRRKRRRRRRRPNAMGPMQGAPMDAGMAVFQPANGAAPPPMAALSPDGEPRRRRRRRRRGRRKRGPGAWQGGEGGGAPPAGSVGSSGSSGSGGS